MNRQPQPTDPRHGLSQAVHLLRSQGLHASIDVAIILGSGLGGFENRLVNATGVNYDTLPGFPGVTVPGHAGMLTFGTIARKQVLVYSGRFHRYEGHSQETTTLPVRLAAELGARHLIVSNAAGGIREDLRVGDLMQITGYLSLSPRTGSAASAAAGLNSTPASLEEHVIRASTETGVPIRRGTYMYVTGPSYETPAEIRAFRRLGADAVGMSTVPEVVAAARLGMRCAGISLITNAASGMTGAALDHADIKEVAQRRTDDFSRLVEGIILGLP